VVSLVTASPHHKDHAQLQTELAAARTQVQVGGVYAHYKYPSNHYKVIGLGWREATDELCVIYQAEYDPTLVFIRELSSWLETPDLHGQPVPRFILQTEDSTSSV
jgi:hypothetical protein